MLKCMLTGVEFDEVPAPSADPKVAAASALVAQEKAGKWVHVSLVAQIDGSTREVLSGHVSPDAVKDLLAGNVALKKATASQQKAP